MKIVIPTKGRIANQLTLENLPPDLYVRTILVCPSNERFWLSQRHPHIGGVVVQPDDEMGIAFKRKWIVETCEEDKIVMLDDDLRFAVRRDDNRGLFRKATAEDILRAFEELDNRLSPEIPHAGFSVRGSGIGASAKEGGWQTTGKRMIYTLGYYLPIVKKEVEFGRILSHEDMDITLQLLSKGYPNAVNFSFVVDQKFGNPGGCSQERKISDANDDCMLLAHYFPSYVSVDEKTYTNSPSRLETRCSWMKCLEDGIRARKLRESK